MLKLLLPIAVLVALLIPATAGAAVTIQTSKNVRDIRYGDSVRVKGKTGDYRGPVTLEIDEFPYEGSYVDSATVSTNDKGEYVFPRVGPTRNARIRARIAGPVRSKAIEVFVYPADKFKSSRADFDHDRVSMSISGPPGFTLPPDKLYIYMLKRKSKAFQRLGGARTMTQSRDGVYRWKGLVRLPSSKHGYTYILVYCVKDSPEGWGRPSPEQRACGERRINVRN
ncbi:MAG TPA: hypothetical protein VF715_08470 [Thermoleophilaceae bacterium]